MPSADSGPLDGVKVLDLSRFIAGPMCAMLLGDMGADVIKVERPGGEDARGVAPFWNDESIYSMTYNRNKRAITLNTRSAEGLAVLWRLAGWADVVVENYRPGTLEAMGFGYDELRRRKPGIIVTSVSGYGQHGPLRERALFDCIVQAASGMMYRNGDDGQEPQLVGMFAADHIAGLYASFGTVLAILEQRRSGYGQHVDVALFDSLFSCLGPVVSGHLMLGSLMPRTGNRDAFAAPANIFRASDGYVYLHAGTDPLFRRFCKLIDRADLLDDARFNGMKARVERVHEIEAIVAEWIGKRTAGECERLVAGAGIPISVVADIPQAVAHPQISEREMVVRIATPKGEICVPGNPVKLSATPVRRYRAPPGIGENTDEILKGLLGYSQQALQELREAGAI